VTTLVSRIIVTIDVMIGVRVTETTDAMGVVMVSRISVAMIGSVMIGSVMIGNHDRTIVATGVVRIIGTIAVTGAEMTDAMDVVTASMSRGEMIVREMIACRDTRIGAMGVVRITAMIGVMGGARVIRISGTTADVMTIAMIGVIRAITDRHCIVSPRCQVVPPAVMSVANRLRRNRHR